MSDRQLWNADRAQTLIGDLAHLPGALLPILQALQEEVRYIDPAAKPLIADALNLSDAEVHGVVTFYNEFRQTPPGRHVLLICRGAACQSMGCEALVRHVEKQAASSLVRQLRMAASPSNKFSVWGIAHFPPQCCWMVSRYGRVSPGVADFLIDDAKRRQ